MADRHKGHEAHCAHVLAFCERCEVPYCTKCNYEWAKPCTLSHYWINGTQWWPSTPTIYPSYWGTTTGGSYDGGSVTTTNTAGAAVLDEVRTLVNHAGHA